jgi:60 kDa SS-A/Ro ribonucleoprotein
MPEKIAERLVEQFKSKNLKIFPYEIMVAYLNIDKAIPKVIRDALHKVMELATKNIPNLGDKKIRIFPDVSGSMSWRITNKNGIVSSTRFVDVAALFACAMLRVNPQAQVIPFEGEVVEIKLDPNASIMDNAAVLSKIGGGGTRCSAPLEYLNNKNDMADLCCFISDNESWMDAENSRKYIVQARNDRDTVNIGGFSDNVFDILHSFLFDRNDPDHWIKRIEAVSLEALAGVV